MQQQMNMRIL